MKALLLLAGIILGVSAFERDSSEVEESLDAAAAERSPDQARSCKDKGEPCNEDCDCCGRFNTCGCHLGFSCRCEMGHIPTCLKKENCANPAARHPEGNICFPKKSPRYEK
uniref:U64-Sparatoxin-Hju1a_2 n=1 Tax=Heteropoda jugulans TaxID=1358901 RepID=A0A4V2H9I1_9ARAC